MGVPPGPAGAHRRRGRDGPGVRTEASRATRPGRMACPSQPGFRTPSARRAPRPVASALPPHSRATTRSRGPCWPACTATMSPGPARCASTRSGTSGSGGHLDRGDRRRDEQHEDGRERDQAEYPTPTTPAASRSARHREAWRPRHERERPIEHDRLDEPHQRGEATGTAKQQIQTRPSAGIAPTQTITPPATVTAAATIANAGSKVTSRPIAVPSAGERSWAGSTPSARRRPG